MSKHLHLSTYIHIKHCVHLSFSKVKVIWVSWRRESCLPCTPCQPSFLEIRHLGFSFLLPFQSLQTGSSPEHREYSLWREQGLILKSHRWAWVLTGTQRYGSRDASTGFQWAGWLLSREEGWMAFASVSCNTVWLLKAFATELTREAQGSLCLCMFAPVPVQGGLLTAGKSTDLTLQGFLSSVDTSVDD